MHIVSMVKLLIGVALIPGGVGVLVFARTQRGFSQAKQAGAMMIVVGAIFIAIGLGFNLRSLFA